MLTTRTGRAMPFRVTVRSFDTGVREGLGFDGFAGHDDLAALGERADPRRLMHAHPRVVVDHDRRLRCVQSRSGPAARIRDPSMLRQQTLDRDAARSRRGRVVERGEESVPGRVHDLPVLRLDRRTQRLVVPAHHVLPMRRHRSSPAGSSSPTMSVNMNVRATRRPAFGAPASMASRHRAASSVAPNRPNVACAARSSMTADASSPFGSMGHREVPTRLRGLERKVGARSSGGAPCGARRWRQARRLRTMRTSTERVVGVRAPEGCVEVRRDLDELLGRTLVRPPRRGTPTRSRPAPAAGVREPTAMADRRGPPGSKRTSHDRAPTRELEQRQPGLPVVPALHEPLRTPPRRRRGRPPGGGSPRSHGSPPPRSAARRTRATPAPRGELRVRPPRTLLGGG